MPSASRSLPLSSSCLFVILISMLVLAQSSRAPVVNQPSGLPIAQDPHPGVLPSLSQIPQGTFAQHGDRVAKGAASGSGAQSSGLGFASVVTYGSGGYYAWSVAAADVNGDGIPDIMVADYSSGTVDVLLANGDGTFQTAVPYGSGGTQAISVAIADVNGDGKPDVLVTNGEGVGVLLGNGDGTFQTAATFGSGAYGARSLAIADVNGDGIPDIVVANEESCLTCDTGSVGVLLGNGDGTFQTAVTYGSGGLYALSVAVADVNGDGKPDIVVANEFADSSETRGAVDVLLGNGDGTFQSAVTYDSGGGGAYWAAVADVNGDGKPDLVVANEGSGTVDVLLGNGDGTFQTAVEYVSGLYPIYVAIADVNGDGKPDIVVAYLCYSSNCSNGSVGVLLGNGDGTFQTAVPYGSGGYNAQSGAVADVNGDGKPDLLVANQCVSSSNCSNGSVGVLINTSTSATTTALVSSPNPSSFGHSVTLIATVTAQQFFGKGPPTGSVNFFDGTTNLGSYSLNSSGVATFTTSTLAVGTHSITAIYNGDTNFASSTSPVLSQVVQGATVLLSPKSLNFGNQPVGRKSISKRITLSNKGSVSLSIASVSITGTNAKDFAETNTCGNSLKAGASCSITVTFTPQAKGTRMGSVSVRDNGGGSPQTASLAGTGT